MHESLQLIKDSEIIWDPGWHNILRASVNTRGRPPSNELLTSSDHAAKESHRVSIAILTELSDTSNNGNDALEYMDERVDVVAHPTE